MDNKTTASEFASSLPRLRTTQNSRIMESNRPSTTKPRANALLGMFVLAIACILVRYAFLEWTYGSAFRDEATAFRLVEETLAAPRGRILSAEGVVLAEDRRTLAVAVHYRFLERPPNPGWLRAEVRRRFARQDRRDPRKAAAQESELLAELDTLHPSLAELCGLPLEEWDRRRRQIQARVERIAEAVNRRRSRDVGENDSDPPDRIVVVEETEAHPVVWGVSQEVAAAIAARPSHFPGVEILEESRRFYPLPLASHVVGHLGAVRREELSADTELHACARVGRMGVEYQYESLLRGRNGMVVCEKDHKGKIRSEVSRRPAVEGRDVRLTLRAGLQEAAERVLDDALRRRDALHPGLSGGGAIVLMDVHTGAILVAASAPRFDSNLFETGDDEAIRRLMADPDAPFFDRVTRMELPPGSVFKIVTAAALVESRIIDPRKRFNCRGYLHDPGSLRCEIFKRRGTGHGMIDFYGALTQSCNVYFFHHAEVLGNESLMAWAGRFGLGKVTGIDLPGEPPGNLSNSDDLATLRLSAIGQGPITATPLQVVRLTAAIANGGRLVTPHVVEWESFDAGTAARFAPRPIADIHSRTLDMLRDAMEMVVTDPRGTAYSVLRDAAVSVSAKTGTAETADGPPHAWLAGYTPSDSPRLAFVIILERAGDAAEAAGPVAERLTGAIRREGLLKSEP